MNLIYLMITTYALYLGVQLSAGVVLHSELSMFFYQISIFHLNLTLNILGIIISYVIICIDLGSSNSGGQLGDDCGKLR